MQGNRKPVMAFTSEQLARLAGISIDRLRYWEKTGAFIPQRASRLVSGPYARFYNFQDLVSLRAMTRLRKEFKVDLGDLRNVSQYLNHHSNEPWSSLAVRVSGMHLEFRNPLTGMWTSSDPIGQSMLEIEFEEVSAEAETDAREAMRRRPEHFGQIIRNRNVMSNQAVFEGTRIPVATVVRLLEAEYSESDILRCYPTLNREDISAAQNYDEEKFDAA